MSYRTRSAGGWILVALGFLVAEGVATARADYPDYAPAPPSAVSDRGDRPAELRRPIDAPRELRRPGDKRAAEAGEGGGGPKQVPVRFQPDDYEEAAPARSLPAKAPSAQPINLPSSTQLPPVQPASAVVETLEIQPVVAIKQEPEKLTEPAASIPLSRESPAPRSLWRNSEMPPWMAGAGSLGIVLGLFLLVAWVVRRGMPKNVAILPREAVEVLGRAPLFGREQVYLIRCGNKVVLVANNAGKLETLTEIHDPDEVDRLAGICQQLHPQSATASFRQVFQQFGQQPAQRSFMGRSRSGEIEFGDMDDVGHFAAGESRA